jgi:hypothetical protein
MTEAFSNLVTLKRSKSSDHMSPTASYLTQTANVVASNITMYIFFLGAAWRACADSAFLSWTTPNGKLMRVGGRCQTQGGLLFVSMLVLFFFVFCVCFSYLMLDTTHGGLIHSVLQRSIGANQRRKNLLQGPGFLPRACWCDEPPSSAHSSSFILLLLLIIALHHRWGRKWCKF